ncbi:MAG: VTT domain-containing protein [Desulfobulbaceae bacterium]|nr:VTT domain-containing protein [Desulfobulbaceae bacterium]
MSAWLDRKKRWLAIAALLGGLTILFVLLQSHPLFRQLLFDLKGLMADIDQLRDRILSYGPLAPLLYIVLQILQVILAPIPGEASGFLGGYLFGGFGAFIYSTIGLSIGSGLAFGIARLMGDNFRRRFHQSRVYQRFNKLLYKNAFVVPFVLFLFPGFPKDSLSYILGLSLMPWRVFLFIAVIGRMPGTLLLSYQGAQVYERDYRTLAILLLISLAISLPFYLYRRGILTWLNNLGHHHEGNDD